MKIKLPIQDGLYATVDTDLVAAVVGSDGPMTELYLVGVTRVVGVVLKRERVEELIGWSVVDPDQPVRF